MPYPLAAAIRKQFPGQYDDITDDAALEAAILKEHPEYQDLATPPAGEGYTRGYRELWETLNTPIFPDVQPLIDPQSGGSKGHPDPASTSQRRQNMAALAQGVNQQITPLNLMSLFGPAVLKGGVRLLNAGYDAGVPAVKGLLGSLLAKAEPAAADVAADVAADLPGALRRVPLKPTTPAPWRSVEPPTAVSDVPTVEAAPVVEAAPEPVTPWTASEADKAVERAFKARMVEENARLAAGKPTVTPPTPPPPFTPANAVKLSRPAVKLIPEGVGPGSHVAPAAQAAAEDVAPAAATMTKAEQAAQEWRATLEARLARQTPTNVQGDPLQTATEIAQRRIGPGARITRLKDAVPDAVPDEALPEGLRNAVRRMDRDYDFYLGDQSGFGLLRAMMSPPGAVLGGEAGSYLGKKSGVPYGREIGLGVGTLLGGGAPLGGGAAVSHFLPLLLKAAQSPPARLAVAEILQQLTGPAAGTSLIPGEK